MGADNIVRLLLLRRGSGLLPCVTAKLLLAPCSPGRAPPSQVHNAVYPWASVYRQKHFWPFIPALLVNLFSLNERSETHHILSKTLCPVRPRRCEDGQGKIRLRPMMQASTRAQALGRAPTDADPMCTLDEFAGVLSRQADGM